LEEPLHLLEKDYTPKNGWKMTHLTSRAHQLGLRGRESHPGHKCARGLPGGAARS
jgi:hypothetical protein